jgi:hypothetical protein
VGGVVGTRVGNWRGEKDRRHRGEEEEDGDKLKAISPLLACHYSLGARQTEYRERRRQRGRKLIEQPKKEVATTRGEGMTHVDNKYSRVASLSFQLKDAGAKELLKFKVVVLRKCDHIYGQNTNLNDDQ